MKEKEGRGSISDDTLFPTTKEEVSDCPTCKGRGSLDAIGENGLPYSRRCRCVLKKDIEVNMDRRWSGLSRSKPIENSILKQHTKKNLWVTSNVQIFKRHLRHVAFRKGPLWDFKVSNDAKLITAWLATASLKGDIFDPDAVSLEELTLIDLVLPPELLIIILGVKTANNKEMANVLIEAMAHREYEDKPTWICDQPHHQLAYGHPSYSEDVLYYLEDWDRVDLGGGEGASVVSPAFIDLSSPPKKSSSSKAQKSSPKAEAPQTKKAGKMALQSSPSHKKYKR